MPHNSELRLKVANRKDFAVPLSVFFILVLIAAALSPQPVLLTLLVLILFGAGLLAHVLGFYKVNEVELILLIFPDGRLRIESAHAADIEGVLQGQQWFTRRVTILRYVTGGKRQYLVLLSARQNADDYRRLGVWLRQDFCSDTG